MKENVLEKADCAYWNGQETGINDAIYDKLSADCGHISKPPATLKGWNKYPDYCLAAPNFGLKKVPYEVAVRAVKCFPKYDGIFIQIFSDEKGVHCVTRGDGRIGKDIKEIFVFHKEFYEKNEGNYELCYKKQDGGRAALCRDITKGVLLEKAILIKHDVLSFQKMPNTEEIALQKLEKIQNFLNVPCDGYVVELATGEKFKYKG